MIFLLLQAAQAEECKREMEKRTKLQVSLYAAARDAIAALANHTCSVIVVDQNLLAWDSVEADMLVRHSGVAPIVFVNTAVYGVDRICKEAEMALKRSQREKALALQGAKQELKDRFSSSVTGVLLSAELALKATPLSPPVEEKLRQIRELAVQLSSYLR
ncbi:MAG TPA: hypothetical protein VKT33_14465 [Candidatus Angelobacter sp.]|nr:hypothetical protein [Candidatus Angelobacter sp.]